MPVKCGACCASCLCEGMFIALVLVYVCLDFPSKGWMSGTEFVT